MEVYLGHEPSLSPHQLKVLRIIAAVADADGKISAAEMAIILNQLSQIFASKADEQEQLRQELQDYLLQSSELNVETLLSEVTDPEERKFILKLSRQVLSSHEADDLEWTAYQRLAQAFNLPLEIMEEIEREAIAASSF
ncbi:MAG: DUF533 domain-containing protein [Microcystaceae cyanobacterium]